MAAPLEGTRNESTNLQALNTPQSGSSVRSTRSSIGKQSEASIRSPLQNVGKRSEIPQTQTTQHETVDLISQTDGASDTRDVTGIESSTSADLNYQPRHSFRTGIVYAPLSEKSNDHDESPAEAPMSKSSLGTKRKGSSLKDRERAKIRALPVHKFIAGGTTGSALPPGAFKSTANRIPNAYFTSVRSPKSARKGTGKSPRNKSSRSGKDDEVLVGYLPTTRSVLEKAGVVFDDEEESEDGSGQQRGGQDGDPEDEESSLFVKGKGNTSIPMTPERGEPSKTPRRMSRSDRKDLKKDLEVLARSRTLQFPITCD